ncbi:hypothetical protein SBOR_9390 [Sclerotinia borealis F-4128]|uniref:Uncharacterized protein n=1 Tax=Sclerotinia borealis (strain F-4128) TaxID=1432307 RepID=W9C6L3_SCLBF|nr:hypothetical protein SBOR_9390 [Sclerotinia borealis F-4128]
MASAHPQFQPQPQHRHQPPHPGPHPQGQQQDNQPLTNYARRFRPKSPGHFKSWLTPLDPLNPIHWDNARVHDQIRLLEDYQKDGLLGFTTRELKDLDVVCDRPLKPSTLAGGIIPLLRRDRWEDKPSTAWLSTKSVPIRNDPLGGSWQSSNDRVWNLLRPIVKLASQYIMSSQSIPWFDALLFGPRRYVVKSRFPPGAKIRDEHHTFHPREGPWTVEREREVAAGRDRIFYGLMNEMDYMFSYFYSNTNPRNSDPPDPTFPVSSFENSLGVTTINVWEMLVRKVPGAKWRIQTFINVEAIEPLFYQYDDLSDSERAALTFRTATTISHEVIHAIGYYQALRRLGPRIFTNHREGYYEHEQMAELGWSWQWAMHGGIDCKVPKNARTRRLLASFSETIFPSFTTQGFAGKNEPVLLSPPIPRHSDLYPIGVQFYEDVHSQDFWDLMVRGFGGRIFQYRTVKEGTRMSYIQGPNDPHLIKRRDRLDPNSHDPYVREDAVFASRMGDIRAQMGNTPEERRLLTFVTQLAESGKTGKEFWQAIKAQVRTVIDIIQAMVQSRRNDMSGISNDLGLMNTAMREVVELLVVAAANHQKAAGLVLERQRQQEDARLGGIPGSGEDVAAKQALLAWNRGTRGFNREVMDRFGNKFKWGELGRKLNYSYNLLEKCQALIFVPEAKEGAISKYPAEQREFDLMNETARTVHSERDPVRASQMCSALVSDRYAGSFVKSAANMLMASCEIEKAGGVEHMELSVRQKCYLLTERGLDRLVWYQQEIGQVTEGWHALCEEYVGWGKRLISNLKIEARDVLPEGEGAETSTGIMGRDRRVQSRKRTKDEVDQLINDVMEDVVMTSTSPQEWKSADLLRQFKKHKTGTESRGDAAPE